MEKGKLMNHVDQRKIVDHQESRYNALAEARVPKLQLEFVLIESSGGACPHCKEVWKKVEVRNMFAEFDYYAPACYCYEECKKCGMPLYGVTPPNTKLSYYRCPRCEFTWPEKKREKREKKGALKV